MFRGETGELNHFLRSGERLMQRIAERERTGHLDALDAESLRGAWNRRVQRHILNQLQADEGTPWTELRRRLQKEYGGGRWTPEEDVLRMFRMRRRSGQSKGEFAAQLLAAYQGVIDKYRETLPGPEATGRLSVIESVALVQLGEAAGKVLTGGVTEAAHALIDAAGRGEEETGEWRRVGPVRTHQPRRPEGPPRRREEYGGGGRRDERRPRERPLGSRRSGRRPDDRRCFQCNKSGHLQAKCPLSRCYECQTPGHLARNCPYIRPSRQSRGEPMEVNVQAPAPRRQGRREERIPVTSESSREETDGDADTTESDDDARSYATVVKRGQKSPRRAGQEAHARQ